MTSSFQDQTLAIGDPADLVLHAKGITEIYFGTLDTLFSPN